MLTSKELDALPNYLLSLYWNLEQGELKKLADTLNVKKLDQLLNLHITPESIFKRIGKLNNKSEKEIESIFKNSVNYSQELDEKIAKSMNKELPPVNAQLINAQVLQTQGLCRNITNSMGFMLNGEVTPLAKVYQKAADNAYLKVSTGLYSLDEAVKITMSEIADKGLVFVEWESGRKMRVENALRMNIITGVNQTVSKISEVNADELETDKFEVSAHIGARDTGEGWQNHEKWQGKVYTKKELHSICGLGAVDGLAGVNCRHTYYPYVEGLSERNYTDEELQNMKGQPFDYNGKHYAGNYEASQKMREIERNIRRLKRMQAAGLDVDNKLRNQYIKYRDFSKASGLPTEYNRLRTYGQVKSQNAKQLLEYKKKENNKIDILKKEISELEKKRLLLEEEIKKTNIFNNFINNSFYDYNGDILKYYKSNKERLIENYKVSIKEAERYMKIGYENLAKNSSKTAEEFKKLLDYGDLDDLLKRKNIELDDLLHPERKKDMQLLEKDIEKLNKKIQDLVDDDELVKAYTRDKNNWYSFMTDDELDNRILKLEKQNEEELKDLPWEKDAKNEGGWKDWTKENQMKYFEKQMKPIYDEKKFRTDKNVLNYKELVNELNKKGFELDKLNPDELTKAGFNRNYLKHTIEDDLVNANPNYKSYQVEETIRKNKTLAKELKNEYHLNCQRCVTTYELRRRGYNVEAGVRQEGIKDMAYGNRWREPYKGWSNNWEMVKTTKANALKKVEETILKHGRNSRGIIGVNWEGTLSGHVFNYECIDGKVRFIDGQTNNNDYTSWVNYCKPREIEVLRTDNLDIDIDKLFKYGVCKNAK